MPACTGLSPAARPPAHTHMHTRTRTHTHTRPAQRAPHTLISESCLCPPCPRLPFFPCAPGGSWPPSHPPPRDVGCPSSPRLCPRELPADQRCERPPEAWCQGHCEQACLSPTEGETLSRGDAAPRRRVDSPVRRKHQGVRGTSLACAQSAQPTKGHRHF